MSSLRRTARLAAASVLAVLGAARLLPGPDAAAAAVAHVAGYQGEVDGFGSWYGSYGMDAIGTAWCIDHGSRAPDPAFGYVPTPVADHSPQTRTALAWLFGRYGVAPDRVTSAALMLVAHDLMGARYPSGVLDVDGLFWPGMHGFGGDAEAVVGRARAVKADAAAHGHLVPPYSFTLEAPATTPGAPGVATARLLDGAGAPVVGVEVRAVAVGTSLSGPATATTGPDGTAAFPFVGALGPYRIEATADPPDLVLQAFASSSTHAQRVARAATVRVAAVAELLGIGRGTLTIVKRGDATPFLPVAGARFEVFAVLGDIETPTLVGDAALVIGTDGRAGPVELVEGRYVVREATPPPGYSAAGPWTIDIPPGGSIVLEVHDVATRGSLTVRKVDAVTGTALPGAVLAIHRDSDGDGTYETAVAEITSDSEPVVLPDLLPGRYRVAEARRSARLRAHGAAGRRRRGRGCRSGCGRGRRARADHHLDEYDDHDHRDDPPRNDHHVGADNEYPGADDVDCACTGGAASASASANWRRPGRRRRDRGRLDPPGHIDPPAKAPPGGLRPAAPAGGVGRCDRDAARRRRARRSAAMARRTVGCDRVGPRRRRAR